MKSIVILFSGEGSNLLNLIDRLHMKHCKIAAAITNRPDAAGIEKAQQRNIGVHIIDHTLFTSREAFDSALVRQIKSYKPDLVVMAGFMRILTPIFTNEIKAINLHPSLLPLFKGNKAIERSFASNEQSGGASVHWVTPELDSGALIVQKSFKKSEDETLESFTKKIHAIEYNLLPETIIQLLNTNE
jgi:phosphoribosylglycinamide formyltransferase-1